MAIIKIYGSDVAGQQQKLFDQSSAKLTGVYTNVRQSYENNMTLMWTDGSPSGGLTVQQKFDAFGTYAASLFVIAQATAAMLSAIDPNYTPALPSSYGYTYVTNPDGTVTVTETT